MLSGPSRLSTISISRIAVKDILGKETELVRTWSGIKFTEIQEMLSTPFLLGHGLHNLECK